MNLFCTPKHDPLTLELEAMFASDFSDAIRPAAERFKLMRECELVAGPRDEDEDEPDEDADDKFAEEDDVEPYDEDDFDDDFEEDEDEDDMDDDFLEDEDDDF